MSEFMFTHLFIVNIQGLVFSLSALVITVVILKSRRLLITNHCDRKLLLTVVS